MISDEDLRFLSTPDPNDRFHPVQLVDREQGEDMSQPELSAAGITWEMAMAKAGQMLAALPTETKMSPAGQDRPEYVNARVSAAQAWIAFARELTMHGRAIR